ncbi:MAG: hypothetical protein KC416_07160, partial [Myxococcales bacterium]|nr:hypothetical protein [Myxococcales bacterium]
MLERAALLVVALLGLSGFSPLGAAFLSSISGTVMAGVPAVSTSSQGASLGAVRHALREALHAAEFDALGRIEEVAALPEIRHGDADRTAIAREYGEIQRRYNDRQPLDKSHFKNRVRGEVEYWDVEAGHPGVEMVGVQEVSPFLAPDGRTRIFNHYVDIRRRAVLEERFGSPSGSIAAEMTNSYRTLMLFPEDDAPFMLKFSGDGWYKQSKGLSPEHVRVSVERSVRQAYNKHVTSEPAGIIVADDSLPVTMVYRSLPEPPDGLRAGDRIVPAHALAHDEFWELPFAKKIASEYGSPGRWYAEEVAPALADAIFDTMVDFGTHLEAHGQNVDVILDADGHVRSVAIKDLLDVMQDHPLDVAQGRTPFGTSRIRDLEWKSMGEADGRYDATGIHRSFLGQLGAMGSEDEFFRSIRQVMVWLADERIDDATRERYPEFDRVLQAAEDTGAYDAARGQLFDVIGAAREMLVRSGLERGFRPDDGARA